jgi:redox-sensitive bicupin YhaK (pirin superfamily)
MITIRRADERGHGEFGWLDTHHTFSFGHYYDPRHMGFSHLRVINEDRVMPGEGFPTHSHRDMEILTYVLDGALEHKDSTGSGGVIRNGDVQRMSAGTGVTHSELNASKTEPVHFLQIWIAPRRHALPASPASYEEKKFVVAQLQGRLRLIASPDGRDGAVTVNQDVNVYAARLDKQEVTHPLTAERKGWVQVARGKVLLNGVELRAGDGAAIEGEPSVTLAGDGAELLLFDLGGLGGLGGLAK